MKELAEALIVLFAITLGFCIGNVYNNSKNNKYDYKINLDYNKIEVYRVDEGDIVIVEPDSLDEFIIKDNL